MARRKRRGKATANHLGSQRRTVGDHRTDHEPARPAAHHAGPGPHRPAGGTQRHHLPDAQRLPVEQVAGEVRRRLVGPSHLPAVDKQGVLEAIWAQLVENCEELGGVVWDWQSADGAMGKARFGGTWSGRTPRIAGKNGTKRKCDRRGGRRTAGRRGGWGQRPRHQAAGGDHRGDRGRAARADAPSSRSTCAWTKATTIRPGERRRRRRTMSRTFGGSAKRNWTKRNASGIRPAAGWWERTLGWMSKCRAILVRYAKKSCNYLGLIQLCCGLLWFRRQHRLTLLR